MEGSLRWSRRSDSHQMNSTRYRLHCSSDRRGRLWPIFRRNNNRRWPLMNRTRSFRTVRFQSQTTLTKDTETPPFNRLNISWIFTSQGEFTLDRMSTCNEYVFNEWSVHWFLWWKAEICRERVCHWKLDRSWSNKLKIQLNVFLMSFIGSQREVFNVNRWCLPH